MSFRAVLLAALVTGLLLGMVGIDARREGGHDPRHGADRGPAAAAGRDAG